MFLNILIDYITQQQVYNADSGSSITNDINKDYIQIEGDLTTSEISTDEDIIKDVMTSNEPDNDNNNVLDDDLEIYHQYLKLVLH